MAPAEVPLGLFHQAYPQLSPGLSGDTRVLRSSNCFSAGRRPVAQRCEGHAPLQRRVAPDPWLPGSSPASHGGCGVGSVRRGRGTAFPGSGSPAGVRRWRPRLTCAGNQRMAFSWSPCKTRASATAFKISSYPWICRISAVVKCAMEFPQMRRVASARAHRGSACRSLACPIPAIPPERSRRPAGFRAPGVRMLAC